MCNFVFFYFVFLYFVFFFPHVIICKCLCKGFFHLVEQEMIDSVLLHNVVSYNVNLLMSRCISGKVWNTHRKQLSYILYFIILRHIVSIYICRVSYRIFFWGGGGGGREFRKEGGGPHGCLATPTFAEKTPI